MTQQFDSDDGPYFAWLRANPTGYVLNVERSPRPAYMVLHRAECPHISRIVAPGRAGGFTERDYIKICSPTLAALSAWVKQHGRPSGSFSKRCARCSP